MKYLMFIALALSLSVFSFEANASEYKKNQTESDMLQRKIQKKINKDGTCNPQQTSRLPTFN